MKKTPIFCGVGTAMITPFTKDGRIDFNSLKALTEIQLEADVDALVMCGTTGEASTLTLTEKVEIVAFVKDLVKGKCPVIAGAGSNDTATACRHTVALCEAGADGILAVTPYYNKTTQKGIVTYYEDLCSAGNRPVIAYNVPSRTGLNILPDTANLLSGISNLCGLKEASGNMAQITEICGSCNDSLPLYCGSDEIAIPVISVGGIGFISVLSNVDPKGMKKMWTAWKSGDIQTAAALQHSFTPVIKRLFSSVNPIPVKKMLNEKGLTEYVFRKPLCAE